MEDTERTANDERMMKKRACMMYLWVSGLI